MTKDYEIQPKSLKKFFSSKRNIVYYIPNYQRNYSWQKQQVQEFFNDVYDQMGSNSQHYFGMIMTLTRSSDIEINELELIDGQQRIITSIIFLVCIRDIFYELNSNLEKTINAEIFNDVAQNSKYYYKITPDELTDNFFHDMLRHTPTVDNEFFYNIRKKISKDIYKSFYKNGNTPKKSYSKLSKLPADNTEANRLLMKAYMTIREEITEKISGQLDDPKISNKLNTVTDYKKLIIQFLCNLHDTLMENSFLSNIVVYDDSKVYSIFNGINNRGLKLSMSDTVKNWILYHMYKESPNDNAATGKGAVLRWKSMESRTTKSKLDNYIHHYLITYHSKVNDKFQFIKKINSFSTIKDILNKNHKSQTSSSATKLLNDICNKFEKYNLLIHPESAYDDLKRSNRRSQINEEAANNIYWIHKLMSVIVYPILMAGLEKYDKKEDFAKLTRMILTWFFINRTVNKREASQLERELAEITYSIMNQNANKQFNVKDVQNELLKTTDMDRFFKRIPTITLNDAASTYFLTILEYGRPRKVDDDTLEHIMPKKNDTIQALPNDETMTWLQYIQKVNPENEDSPKEIHARYKNRLGNLTLLESDLNKLLKDELFPTKLSGVFNKKNEKRSYNDSRIKLTLEICEESEKDWTIERIDNRQKKFAKRAEEFWKIE